MQCRHVLGLKKTAWTTLLETYQQQSNELDRKEEMEIASISGTKLPLLRPTKFGAASAIAATEHTVQTHPIALR